MIIWQVYFFVGIPIVIKFSTTYFLNYETPYDQQKIMQILE